MANRPTALPGNARTVRRARYDVAGYANRSARKHSKAPARDDGGRRSSSSDYAERLEKHHGVYYTDGGS